MEAFAPDWNQPKPTFEQAQDMCRRIPLTAVTLESTVFNDVLSRIRESHANGGAFLAAAQVGPDSAFDWFGSRNRLLEFDILPSLLTRPEVREQLAALQIPASIEIPEATLLARSEVRKQLASLQIPASVSLEEREAFVHSMSGVSFGFEMKSTFDFDGQLAQILYNGGAYSRPHGDGRSEKQLALDFCEAAFDRRFGEVAYYATHVAWAPWFCNVAWDWTAVLFDHRLRRFWILCVTDTD